MAGVILGTVVAVLWGVFTVVRGAFRMFEGGAPPALDAMGPAIPESLLNAARAEGSLHEGETVYYAFIPAGHTATDAMIITDSVLIRRSARGARRLELEHASLDIRRTTEPGWDGPRGLLIAKYEGGIRDTIYDSLSGAEVIRMMTDLRAYQAELKSAQQDRERTKAP
jgi:hypothetical protein